MSRIGAWWLRHEKSIADGCEDFVVALGLGPWIGIPYAHRPTRRELAEQSATQLTRIADALESSQLGSEATAPAGDPPQPPSPGVTAAGGLVACMAANPNTGDLCCLPPGHAGNHLNLWSAWPQDS